ncbi:MAG: acetyltransferase [Eubacterium sp.]|nr:acetyltransferase [Eubacterium sp.]
MEKIILIGGGGHACSVADSILRSGRYEIAGFVDRGQGKEDVLGKIPFIGKDDDLADLYRSGIRNAFVTVGYLGRESPRERIYNRLKQIGYRIPGILDPASIVSDEACIGEGTFVGKGAVINANARVGKMCIINTKAIVEHDVLVGDFSHVAVGGVLCGNVQVGRSVFIGANATVIQNVRVGDGAVIGAGASVRHEITAGQVYYGG